MHKTLFICALLLLFLSCPRAVSGQQTGNAIQLDVTDRRKVVTRSIGRGLLLKVVKERSERHEHFGWRLEVVRKPYRHASPNLLYRNKAGYGADQSQVYAWHLAERQFPNERELKVRGYPYTVRVVLADCAVEGSGAEARFISGEMRISWERHR